MNKKAAYALRIVLGAYLAFLGVKLIMQMMQEKPTNMIFICAMSVIFVIVGGGYAIYSLIKLLDIRKEEKGEVIFEEPEEESSSAADNPNAVRRMNMQSTEIKKVQKDSTAKESAESAEAAGKADSNEDTSADCEEPVDMDDEESLSGSDSEEEMGQETIEEEIENDYEEK